MAAYGNINMEYAQPGRQSDSREVRKDQSGARLQKQDGKIFPASSASLQPCLRAEALKAQSRVKGADEGRRQTVREANRGRAACVQR